MASAATLLGMACVVSLAAAGEPPAEPAPAARPEAGAEAVRDEPVAPAAKPAAAKKPATADDDAADDIEDDTDGDFEAHEGRAAEEPREGEVAEPPPSPPSGPPRPGPLPAVEPPESPAWERHLEVGGGVVYASRPLLGDLPPATPRYAAGVGFGVHLRWDLLSFLRIHPYFIDVAHAVGIPQGALTTESENSISRNTSFPETTAYTFSFGASLEPTLRLSDRVRGWLSAGVGWGRIRIPVQAATDPAVGELFIRDRSFSFVEFPLGLGAGVEVIRNWLAVGYDLTVVPAVGQAGDALESFQAIDATGQARDVGPLEAFELSFVHSLSVALIL